ncbi:curli production assembly protein CsgE [Pseudoalteromonas sp. MMG013]|uniref:Curli production assembly/transport component CsgE n=1 Tax=Pseudoalteromonas aurantia 208 TaxID=1314867 RepID=A0ABR9EGV7_9GAMM|nr:MULTISPECIES: CsgE family curli-type amyloid fiber assembly protein [Pseudoalteromonas]MBE0368988.1 curli production assembly/transport component CsgE [Pseudoalteromonas aurantia 208]MBQ4847555.1 curli production assembly protein CsgE [Pseudoalteromonas sp. MMG005]MBQ4851502.1 curli production assembly protein CsgE [Pseudoalteromonas sp. MMG012]MBQ4864512.1 curli production assembly protein CsgE [Pseudoalteromonas sp. MMG013]
MNAVLKIFFFIIISTSNSIRAQEDIGGFLLDQSISRSGYEFYYQLSMLWQDIPNTSGASVVIKETLIPRAGTVLKVELNNKIVYQTFMGRRLKPIDEQVEQAAITLVNLIASNNFSEFNQDMASSGL